MGMVWCREQAISLIWKINRLKQIKSVQNPKIWYIIVMSAKGFRTASCRHFNPQF